MTCFDPDSHKIGIEKRLEPEAKRKIRSRSRIFIKQVTRRHHSDLRETVMKQYKDKDCQLQKKKKKDPDKTINVCLFSR